MKKILIVDDEKDIRFILEEILNEHKYHVITLGTIKEAEEFINKNSFDLALLDVLLDEKSRDGLYLLNLIKNKNKDLPVIMMSGHANIQIAVNSVKDGAFEFLEKPFNQERLLNFIKRGIEYSELLNTKKDLHDNFFKSFDFIGESKEIVKIKEAINKISTSDGRIFIEGPSGSGKELLAREIHRNSNRNKSNFVILDSSRINISNFDENIFGIFKNGELIKGHLEKANNGTLFIDNVHDLPLDVQNKILRVITDQRFKRLNDTTDITVNFRLISSSSINLAKEVSDGNFREDLFHRLNVINLNLPALVDRLSDIPLLIEYFFSIFVGNSDYKKNIKNLDLFYSYNWPGNVRELRNLVERIAILGQDNVEKIENIIYSTLNPKINIEKKNSSSTDLTLREARDNFEKEYLMKQLKKNDGNVSNTAKSVGMDRAALQRKLSSLNIRRK
ncbi:MAG: sigma-54-dependent Fis family transcriptional regulator [Pelagibacteraceae bacterium]|nr:sigma-54-dependent Fis family transcriptional regulator [Pelagibacteraceae bacterium]|tara:strand:- start:609 stop:1949 length:1341 start_codon:yes stop_codon:yes gene_type:complete